jgi:hypothetical protein
LVTEVTRFSDRAMDQWPNLLAEVLFRRDEAKQIVHLR